MRILHAPSASEPFVVAFKDSGIPSAPLSEGDDSVLTRVAEMFPSVASVSGRKAVEGGLVHRLDTATEGIVLLAASQDFYDQIQKWQGEGKFVKSYLAKVDFLPDCAKILGGFPPDIPNFDGGVAVAESFFRKFGRNGSQVRPVTEKSGPAALKKCSVVIYSTGIRLSENSAVCSIRAGYRHQVRCHLAWCGIPVSGDRIYNPGCALQENPAEKMMFRAFRIEFPGFSFEV